MEHLTKFQLVLLVLLVSFITSLVTGIVTVTLVNQAPPALTQTIYKVIDKAVVSQEDGNIVETTENALVITQEDLIVKLVRDSANAVVSVIATKDIPVIEQYYINPFGDDDLLKQMLPSEFWSQFQVPQYRQKGTAKQEISSGTGFFISSDGMIITNRHVVEDAEAEYSIIMNDGKKLPVKVLARDPLYDVAVLQADGANFSYLPLGSSDSLSVGQSVVAIGNALGEFQNTVSVGVISGLKRTITASGSAAGLEVLQGVIQTDAAINPGNSGGPLLDLAGRVIGINSAVAAGAENIGFALPINVAKKDIADIKEFGKIRYAFLGARFIMVNKSVQEEKKLPVDYGALLAKSDEENAVMSDSPAEKAGLAEGDIILTFNDARVDQNNPLNSLIANSRVGDKITLKILRAGEEITKEVLLGERPANI